MSFGYVKMLGVDVLLKMMMREIGNGEWEWMKEVAAWRS